MLSPTDSSRKSKPRSCAAQMAAQTQCHPNYTADIRKGVAVEYVSCEPSENLKELFPDEYGDDDEFLEDEETEQA